MHALEPSHEVLQLPDRFSREEAQSALLAAQGLASAPTTTSSKADVLRTIDTMGQLQIDTISVVARSPYLVLWTRLGNYDPVWLDELLAEGAIYEAWSHEACFLPASDLPNTRTRINGPVLWRKSLIEFLEEHRKQGDQFLAYIADNGPVRSADFVNPSGNGGGWWNWKHEKMLLESLFTAGELMVVRREKFQRVYDLTNRVHPEIETLPLPTPDEMAADYVVKSVRAMGIAHRSWIADYYRMRNYEFQHLLPRLVESGKLLQTSIEGIPGSAFVHPDSIPMLTKLDELPGETGITRLLSPFDPVVWHRKRSEMLFDFSYRIECYTPESKRQYGYFSLPILHNRALVGRLDAKAHRKDGLFEIRALHLEPGIRPSDELIDGLASILIDCAAWHETPELLISHSNPRRLRRSLTAEIKRQQKSGRL